jgi:ATP-dependent Clp protease ATP-binding subunit ClpA
MFQRFDRDMRRAVFLAYRSAVGFDCRPGAEHLLLGLVRLKTETVELAEAFARMGCPQEAVLAAVEELAGRREDPPFTEFFRGGLVEVDVADFSPQARQVLERAVREADADLSLDVRAVHLVAALLDEEAGGPARQILSRLAPVETIKAMLFQFLGRQPLAPAELSAAAALRWETDADQARLVIADPAIAARVQRLIEQADGHLAGTGILAREFLALRQSVETWVAELNWKIQAPPPHPDEA